MGKGSLFLVMAGNLLHVSVVVVFLFPIFLSAASAGRCDYPSDIARDGSRCGDRAASVRPGGRNPDTDWIFWAIALGIGVVVCSKIMSASSSQGNRTPNREEKKIQASQRSSCNYEGSINVQNSLIDIQEDEGGFESPNRAVNKTAVRKILTEAYEELIQPYQEDVFSMVCEQTAEMGGNNQDAAARYVLVQIGSIYDMPGSNITQYVDRATKKLAARRNLLFLPMPGYITALNEMRKSRGLNSIGD